MIHHPPGPPLPNWKGPMSSPPMAEVAIACGGAGRGLTMSSPAMISPTTCSGRRRRSSYVAGGFMSASYHLPCGDPLAPVEGADMSALKLCLAIHNHQPVGNFDEIFERAFATCYEPFVDALERHPRLRV